MLRRKRKPAKVEPKRPARSTAVPKDNPADDESADDESDDSSEQE